MSTVCLLQSLIRKLRQIDLDRLRNVPRRTTSRGLITVTNVCIDSPIVILLAVNVSVSAEASDFAIESLTAVRALKAGRVPPPVHRLQVKPVGYP